MERLFYYSKPWREARERLPGPPDRLRVQWWDDEEVADDKHEMAADEGADPLIEAALDPSPRGRLDGLVESFVSGWPRNRLIRKQGFGMEPPFERMRKERSAIVEMRTNATRTFGFFVRQRVFVAHRLDLTDNLKASPLLYEQYGNDVLKLFDRMERSERDGESDVEDLIGD